MVSTLKVNKIQIPNSDSDVISLDATTGNIAFNKPVTETAMVKVADLDFADGVTNCDIDSTHINQHMIAIEFNIDLSQLLTKQI